MSNDFVMTEIGMLGKATDINRDLVKQDKIIDEYIEVLDDILKTSIKEGNVHDVLEQMSAYMKSVVKYDSGTADSVNSKVKTFVSRIDSIDLKIYGD